MAVSIAQSEELLYSRWSGYNYYKPLKERFSSAIGDYSLLVNVRSGQKCFWIPVPQHRNKLSISHWLYMISHPPVSTQFVWPIDIIDGPNGNALVFPIQSSLQAPTTSVLSENNTLEYEETVDQDNGGFTFGIPRSSRHFGLEAQWAKHTLLDLLHIFDMLETEGYAPHDISNKSLFAFDDRIVLDFSFDTQIVPLEGSFDLPIACGCPDYADPYYWGQKKGDLISARFSLASVVFKLIIGILPYKGRAAHDYGGDNKDQHYGWLEQYFANPVFIFEQNESNALPAMAENIVYVQRWERLPEKSRQMFVSVFACENAMRRNGKTVSYSAKEWLESLPI